MVTLKLFPPYSTVVGEKEVRFALPGGQPVSAPEFFYRFCEQYPVLRELFFASGSVQGFPGYTSVLRDGVSLRGTDAVRPADVLEVLTALSGG